MSAAFEPERAAFEAWFAPSRPSRGKGRAPSYERLPDGTYADDHTQRHWWTWQCAISSQFDQWCAEMTAAKEAEAPAPAKPRHATDGMPRYSLASLGLDAPTDTEGDTHA